MEGKLIINSIKLNYAALLLKFFLIIFFICRVLTIELTKHCRYQIVNYCSIKCQNLNFDDTDDLSHLSMSIEKTIQNHSHCDITITRSSGSDENWIKLFSKYNLKITKLAIKHSSIDLNNLNLSKLVDLKQLIIKNTTTRILKKHIFVQAPYLEKLIIQNNLLLTRAEINFLQNSRLNFLKIQGISLGTNETHCFFKNLTGGNLNQKFRTLNWSHNNFGFFKKDLLRNYKKVDVMILSHSKITNFEEGTFVGITIKKLYIEGNRIKTLPEINFKPLLKKKTQIFVKGNQLTCDCQVAWLKDYLKKGNMKNFGDFQNVFCESPVKDRFIDVEMCEKQNQTFSYGNAIKDYNKPFTFYINCDLIETEDIKPNYTRQNNHTESGKIQSKVGKKFTVRQTEPNIIEVNLLKITNNLTWWLADFSNSSLLNFRCIKAKNKNFFIQVTAGVNYFLCVGTLSKVLEINFQDCLTLTSFSFPENSDAGKKSITLSAILITIGFLFALALGALILYLYVHKNPSLIRHSKRVIVVKRRDKAQILIMPRTNKNFVRNEDNRTQDLTPYVHPSELPRPSVSYDTLSTVSYVSANQPSQLELLTYRLSRWREIFQQNNNMPTTTYLPVSICSTPRPPNLPPNVDLLLEYEWYTITTSTSTTTSTMM